MPQITRRDFTAFGVAAASLPYSTRAVAQNLATSVLLPGKPYAGKTVNFISLNYTYSQGLKAAVPSFEQATGIKVNFELLGTLDNIQKQRLELSAGSGTYDVYQVPPFNRAEYHKAGWLEPLDDFIANSSKTPQLWGLGDFFPVSLSQGDFQAKRFDLPIFAATIVLYWRKDVFAAAGLPGPPETLDDLVRSCAAIKSNVKDVAAIGLRGAPGIESNMWPFPTFLYAYGGAFFRNAPSDFRPAIASGESIKAVEVWTRLVREYGFPGMVNATHEELIVQMQQGRLAMVMDGHPLAGVFLHPDRSKSHGKTGVAPIPSGPAGRFPAFSEHGIAIAKNAKNKEASWEFIKWATSADVLLDIALRNNYVAATRRSVVTHPEYRAKYNFANGEFLTATTQMLEERKPTYIPAVPEWGELADVIGNQVSRATLGELSAEQAMRRAAESMDVVMRRAGYY